MTPHLFAQQPYKPLRINEKINLDGKLNEPAWQEAAVEDDFMQYDPSAGAVPSEKSEVRIVYNHRHEAQQINIHQRKAELDLFPKCPPDVQDALFKVSLAREMEFTNLKSKKPFYIIPYAIANYSRESL